MKKTIIAAAVAASVAAPAAFADVKISGMVAPEFLQTDAANSDEGKVYTDLVFSGSEDLGNGLTASFKYHMFADTSGDANIDAVGGETLTASGTAVSTPAVTSLDTVTDPTISAISDTDGGQRIADLTVALSGDFGTVKMGRFEPFAEGVMDAFANIEGVNAIDLESATGFAGRSNGSIAYVSPTMNGLSLGLSTVELGGEFNKANEIMVKYSNGPLMVMANSSNNDSNNVEHTGIAASYKIDALEVRAMKTEMKGQSTTTKNGDYTMFGVKYTMGANTIALGMSDDETATSDTESTLISLTHALSKNTSAYVAYKSDDVTGGTDVETTVIGISQKF